MLAGSFFLAMQDIDRDKGLLAASCYHRIVGYVVLGATTNSTNMYVSKRFQLVRKCMSWNPNQFVGYADVNVLCITDSC